MNLRSLATDALLALAVVAGTSVAIGAAEEVTLDVRETLPTSPLDFVQMTQVITNLLDNALRYSPPGGAISISAEVIHDQLRVTVFNEGSRIPRTELERFVR